MNLRALKEQTEEHKVVLIFAFVCLCILAYLNQKWRAEATLEELEYIRIQRMNGSSAAASAPPYEQIYGDQEMVQLPRRKNGAVEELPPAYEINKPFSCSCY